MLKLTQPDPSEQWYLITYYGSIRLTIMRFANNAANYTYKNFHERRDIHDFLIQQGAIMATHISRSLRYTSQHAAVSRYRTFASVSDARVQAPLSRFEPEIKVDYTDFTTKVSTLRRQ